MISLAKIFALFSFAITMGVSMPEGITVSADHSSGVKPTLSDVASRAGVSVATASKALHNRPRVSASTRDRVLRIAQELSYTPNSIAQSLASGRTNTVGLITSDLQGRFSTPILIGVENELGAQSTSVLLCNVRGDAILEQHHLQSLLSRNVDGLIVVGAHPFPRQPLPRNIGVPVVYAYAPSTDPQDCSVISDNVGAGSLSIEHLLACGKRKIAIITGPRSFIAAVDRVKGATAALEEAGLQPVVEVMYGLWDENWGRGATRMLLERGVDFDAVMCGNDQIARGCIDALKWRGLSIPSDVAVIGHDNWDVLVKSARPTITSIDMQLEKIGALAGARLVDAVNNNPQHGIEAVPCRIVQRDSTLPSLD